MNEQLKALRSEARMTQEELAEKMNVSRQSVAKWESGESVPDVLKCGELAKIFNVSIEDIARSFMGLDQSIMPKNKYIFGKCVIVDNRIVIPNEALRVFGLKNGDELVLFGDVEQGMALSPIKSVNSFVQEFVNAPTFGEKK